MGFKVIPRSVAILSTGGNQFAVDIDHTEDSFTLGDGTRTLEFVEAAPGEWALPVKPIGGGDASAANQTSGDQLTQITDSLKTDTVEIDDVGGEKALKVSVIASVGAAGGASATDQANFTAGASLGGPIMGQYDANGSDDLTDGTMGILRCNAERALHVIEQNPITGYATSAKQDTIIGHVDGIEGLLTTIDADTGSIDTKMTTLIGHVDGIEGSVDGIEGLLTTIDADTGNLAGMLTALQIMDDWDATAGSAHPSDGVMMMISDGTNARRLLGDSSGRPTVNINGTVPVSGTFWQATQPVSGTFWQATQPVSIAASVTVAQSTASNLKAEVVGSAAHDNSSPGVPIMVAARANNANPTAVAAGDVTYLNADLAGRLVTTRSDRALVASFVGDIASTTEETMLAAGGANVFHDLTQLTLTNSNATTDCIVFLRDATAGSTVWQHNIPAKSGMVVHFDPPLNQTTANNNWTIDCTAGVSTIYYTGVALKRLA